MEQKPFPGLRADQAFTYNGPDEMFVQEPDGTIWRIGLTKKPSKQVMERVVSTEERIILAQGAFNA